MKQQRSKSNVARCGQLVRLVREALEHMVRVDRHAHVREIVAVNCRHPIEEQTPAAGIVEDGIGIVCDAFREDNC